MKNSHNLFYADFNSNRDLYRLISYKLIFFRWDINFLQYSMDPVKKPFQGFDYLSNALHLFL